jgi:hypothetical protein
MFSGGLDVLVIFFFGFGSTSSTGAGNGHILKSSSISFSGFLNKPSTQSISFFNFNSNSDNK